MWLSICPSRSSRISGRVRVERSGGVDYHRQRLVLDVDQLERVARAVAIVGDHERDLLALIAHLVGGEHGLDVVDIVGIHASPRASRSDPVITAWTRGCWSAAVVSIETILRVRVRASQDRAVQHPRQLHVVDVRALATDEASILLARHAAEADRRLRFGARRLLEHCHQLTGFRFHTDA